MDYMHYELLALKQLRGRSKTKMYKQDATLIKHGSQQSRYANYNSNADYGAANMMSEEKDTWSKQTSNLANEVHFMSSQKKTDIETEPS